MPDQEFLQPTRFCDCHHPLVRHKAERLSAGAVAAADIAARVFTFMREHVPYRFDFWNTTASHTLVKGRGMCTNKANLQVALLRACGVPAAYGHYRIRREALRPLCAESFYRLVSPVTTHIYPVAWLDSGWVKLDATVDTMLLQTLYRGITGWELVEWDGGHDVELDPSSVVEDLGVHADLDVQLEAQPRVLTEEIVAAANAELERRLLAAAG